MAQFDFYPDDLKFTLASIENRFDKPYDYQRIDDAVCQIRNNQLNPGVLMPLNVVEFIGWLWCLDNRRLWVFRKSRVPTVKVTLVLPNYNRRAENFFSGLIERGSERQYSSVCYFPQVKGGINSRKLKDTIHGALPPSIGMNGAVKTGMAPVSPENLRFTQDSIKNRFKKPYDYQRIDDAVDQIRNNQLSPTVLMPLTVVHYRSVLWSLDNRRLWVLRKAGVPTVKVVLVSRNFNNRSKDFFSSLRDPLLERKYSSADYFPLVRGGCRFVGINPPPPKPLQLNHPTTFAGVVQANSPPLSPPPRPLRDFTVRSTILPLVLDWLWERILSVVDWVTDPSKEKFVLVLVLCFLLYQAHNIWKERVSGTVNEGRKNIFRGWSRENVVISDQKKNMGVSGYLGIIAVKGAVGLGKILSRLIVSIFCFVLSQAFNLLKVIVVKSAVVMGKILGIMFCFLRFVVQNAFD